MGYVKAPPEICHLSKRERGAGFSGNVPVVLAKLFESMKEATGIELADIVNADSYDAQVNRNINVTGLDDINLVVKPPKDGEEQP